MSGIRKVLQDGFSTLYPLASFVSDDLYQSLKVIDENLKKTDTESRTLNMKVFKVTFNTNLGEETPSLGESLNSFGDVD